MVGRIWDEDPEMRARADQERPVQIIVTPGHRHEACDAALAAMMGAATPFYQRNGQLGRVCRAPAKAWDGETVQSPIIMPVTVPYLGRAMGGAARWFKLNAKNKHVGIDPPKEHVLQVHSMAGEWPFLPLFGVIGTPTMRPDGSILTREGYDEQTGLFLIDGLAMPKIPDKPTMEDARVSLQLLLDLVDGFPFIADEHRSVGLSALMTPVLRGALAPAVPMHVISAPLPGTGKSYLADTVSMIATGNRAPVVSFAKDDAETEKRLIGSALSGRPIIAIDNVSKLVVGDFLCQITERPLLDIRPLGTSDKAIIPNAFTVLINGNNLTVGSDVVRRTVQCAMDANIERPEARIFDKNPLEMVRENRGEYVAAILTIARAYLVSGKEPMTPRLGYEGWSKFVRSPLVWLGRADPDKTLATLVAEDPIAQARAELFEVWTEKLDARTWFKTSELIDKAGLIDAWKRALLAIARDRKDPERIDPRRLGTWLSSNRNTISCGRKLVADFSDKTRPTWSIEISPGS